MLKTFKIFCLPLILIILTVSAGCFNTDNSTDTRGTGDIDTNADANGDVNADANGDVNANASDALDTETQDLSATTSPLDVAETIRFGFCAYEDNDPNTGDIGVPRNLKYIDEMLEELNSRTMRELNTKIEFTWFPHNLFNWDDEYLMEFVQSDDAPDAIEIDARTMHKLSNAGMLKDLSELLPLYAPRHYSNIMDSWDYELDFLCKHDGRIFGIPNNDLVSPRYCVIAREDMVDKYMSGGFKVSRWPS